MCSYLASGICAMCCARTSSITTDPDTSRVGQRLTAHEVCPGGRSHSFAAGPRRIAPSLRPDLISDSDRRKSLVAFDSLLPIGIGLDRARIDCKSFATNQALLDATPQGALEHAAE